jgi:hypothetical protein
MNKLTWIFHILLTLTFALFGLQKVLMPIADLVAQGMWWVEDFAVYQVRTLGALEFLAVVGLNMPYLVKAVPKLIVPASAGGLALLMVGAIGTHITRQDPIVSVVINVFLLAMSATVAARRFGEIRRTSPSDSRA